jgi:hypothetical protein
MGVGDDELALVLLRRFLKADLDSAKPATRYVFYNGGVKAALLDADTLDLLKQLEQLGASILLCGTCLDYFGLSELVSVGQNACVGDVRESMAMEQVDYL